MSWLFSRVLVEEFLEEHSSDGELCVPLKSMPTVQAFLHSAKTTKFSRLSRFGMTCALLTADLGEDLLTWFLEGFLVKTSARRGRAQESTESEAAFGVKWPASLARYDPVTRSWRTRQRLLFEDSTECLEIFPKWVTMRKGELWGRSTPALPTNGIGSGLLPTPVSSDYKGSRNPVVLQKRIATKKHVTRLSEYVAWKTFQRHGEIRGWLNPNWTEWLMGWPIGWTGLKPLGTDRFQQWRRKHGGF